MPCSPQCPFVPGYTGVRCRPERPSLAFSATSACTKRIAPALASTLTRQATWQATWQGSLEQDRAVWAGLAARAAHAVTGAAQLGARRAGKVGNPRAGCAGRQADGAGEQCLSEKPWPWRCLHPSWTAVHQARGAADAAEGPGRRGDVLECAGHGWNRGSVRSGCSPSVMFEYPVLGMMGKGKLPGMDCGGIEGADGKQQAAG